MARTTSSSAPMEMQNGDEMQDRFDFGLKSDFEIISCKTLNSQWLSVIPSVLVNMSYYKLLQALKTLFQLSMLALFCTSCLYTSNVLNADWFQRRIY